MENLQLVVALLPRHGHIMCVEVIVTCCRECIYISVYRKRILRLMKMLKWCIVEACKVLLISD